MLTAETGTWVVETALAGEVVARMAVLARAKRLELLVAGSVLTIVRLGAEREAAEPIRTLAVLSSAGGTRARAAMEGAVGRLEVKW